LFSGRQVTLLILVWLMERNRVMHSRYIYFESILIGAYSVGASTLDHYVGAELSSEHPWKSASVLQFYPSKRFAFTRWCKCSLQKYF